MRKLQTTMSAEAVDILLSRERAARAMLAALVNLIPCVDWDDELIQDELNTARAAVREARAAGVEGCTTTSRFSSNDSLPECARAMLAALKAVRDQPAHSPDFGLRLLQEVVLPAIAQAEAAGIK